MSTPKINVWPLSTRIDSKRSLRSQFGALCYRRKGDKFQVLLITSRRTKRWIIPKGWPMDGMAPTQVVATEAWEEAGVRGKVDPRPLGLFSYTKSMDKDDLPCAVLVYALHVKKIENNFPEKDERRRKWVSIKKAMILLDSPELAQILSHFNPKA